MELWGLLLAAGGGRRFGGSKQFEDLGGRTLVARSFQLLAATCPQVVVVGPAPDLARLQDLGATAVVAGGEARQDSVACGLAALPPGAEVVVVHDAAHPLAPPALFDSVLRALLDRPDVAAATPAVELTQAMARPGPDGRTLAEAVPRAGLVALQMPAAFRLRELRAAHAEGVEATDDVSLLLRTGRSVAVVEGDPRNVHITTPAELALARAVVA